MFLTKEELRELTGFALASKQIQWLRANGWKFAEDSRHRPKVAQTYFEERLGSGRPASNDGVAVLPPAVLPRFDLLRAAQSRGRRHGA